MFIVMAIIQEIFTFPESRKQTGLTKLIWYLRASAQAFGFPFLEPNSRRFADSAYRHGVNFALSGATAKFEAIPLPTFFLAREVEKYFDFRAIFSGTEFSSLQSYNSSSE